MFFEEMWDFGLCIENSNSKLEEEDPFLPYCLFIVVSLVAFGGSRVASNFMDLFYKALLKGVGRWAVGGSTLWLMGTLINLKNSGAKRTMCLAKNSLVVCTSVGF